MRGEEKVELIASLPSHSLSNSLTFFTETCLSFSPLLSHSPSKFTRYYRLFQFFPADRTMSPPGHELHVFVSLVTETGREGKGEVELNHTCTHTNTRTHTNTHTHAHMYTHTNTQHTHSNTRSYNYESSVTRCSRH